MDYSSDGSIMSLDIDETYRFINRRVYVVIRSTSSLCGESNVARFYPIC